MRFLTDFLDERDAADIAQYLYERFGPPPPPPRPPPTVVAAVEFYHAGFDHYFVSAIPAEIAALDAGTTIRGWARTGGTFKVGVAFCAPM